MVMEEFVDQSSFVKIDVIEALRLILHSHVFLITMISMYGQCMPIANNKESRELPVRTINEPIRTGISP